MFLGENYLFRLISPYYSVWRKFTVCSYFFPSENEKRRRKAIIRKGVFSEWETRFLKLDRSIKTKRLIGIIPFNLHEVDLK